MEMNINIQALSLAECLLKNLEVSDSYPGDLLNKFVEYFSTLKDNENSSVLFEDFVSGVLDEYPFFPPQHILNQKMVRKYSEIITQILDMFQTQDKIKILENFLDDNFEDAALEDFVFERCFDAILLKYKQEVKDGNIVVDDSLIKDPESDDVLRKVSKQELLQRLMEKNDFEVYVLEKR